MGAGLPNYTRLYEMGKLPKEARKFIPNLAELDNAENELKVLREENVQLKAKVADLEARLGGGDLTPAAKIESEPLAGVHCEVVGCGFVGKNANGLRLHSTRHNKI